MQPDTHEVTLLLERMATGDREAENRLYEIVMPELRRLAQYMMKGERPNHTLQGTELVNRMYLRLTGSKLSLRNRGHFFAIAARTMRRELIDYGRGRPKATLVPMDGLPEKLLASHDRFEVALIIDKLLDEMNETMPEMCSIVELKFFLGLSDDETADALGLSLRTMQLRWQDARIWLFEKAEPQECKGRGKSATS